MAQSQGHQTFQRRYGQVVAQAWRDLAFKQRLLADPVTVLREQGIDVPAGLQVRVVENTGQQVHLVLPAKPGEELSDDELDRVAAAGGLSGGVVMRVED